MTASTAYFQLDDDARARGLLQLLTEDGTPAPGAEADLAGFDRATCRRLYEDMLRIRVTDARMMALQRQGRIGFYGEALGQEAAIVVEAHGWLDAAEHEAMAAILEGAVRDAITRQEATPMPALGTIFDDVYEQPTWLQRDQLGELQAAARVRAPHSH